MAFTCLRRVGSSSCRSRLDGGNRNNAIGAMQAGKEYATMADDCLSMKVDQILVLQSLNTQHDGKKICILSSAVVNFKD